MATDGHLKAASSAVVMAAVAAVREPARLSIRLIHAGAIGCGHEAAASDNVCKFVAP